MSKSSDKSEAVFGLQCFWGAEAKYGIVDGVVSTSVGYTGGSTLNPRLETIADHIEAVRVVFEPKLITYEQLLSKFWAINDPVWATKRQYMSTIFYASEEQKRWAQKSLQDKQKQSSEPIDTEIVALNQFYSAEDCHQKYFLRKHNSILAELKLTDQQLIDSPVATKLNGFCYGCGSAQQLDSYLKTNGIGLSENNIKIIKEEIRGGPKTKY